MYNSITYKYIYTIYMQVNDWRLNDAFFSTTMINIKFKLM